MTKELDWRRFSRGLGFLLLLFGCLVFILWVYRALAVPFFISLFLTYLLTPIVRRFDRAPRSLVVSCLLLLTLAALTFLVLRLFPYLYHELIALIRLTPKAAQTFTDIWIPELRQFVLAYDVVTPREFDHYVKEFSVSQKVMEHLNQSVVAIWHSVPQVLGTVVTIVMVPLMTFFLLKDSETVAGALVRLVPPDMREPLGAVLRRVDLTFRSVLKGQATVALILAALYVMGLSVVGLQASAAIGLTAGLCRVVPYLDVVVGLVLSFLVVFADFQSVSQLVAIVAVFLTVQALDGMLITPRILGKKAGLHPAIVIISVLAFGDLFGFWGVLLSVPTVAVVKELVLHIVPLYYRSRIYRDT